MAGFTVLDGLCCVLLVLELFVVYRLVKYRYCDEHADRKVRIHRRRVRRKTLKAVIVIVPVVVIAVIVVYIFHVAFKRASWSMKRSQAVSQMMTGLGLWFMTVRCIFR